jgi:hypothetical protein
MDSIQQAILKRLNEALEEVNAEPLFVEMLGDNSK